MKPKNHAIGIPHQTPLIPNLKETKYDTGIRITHNENNVINMGIKVSPAPRKTPANVNIVENRI